jgi:hypothetical protein
MLRPDRRLFIHIEEHTHIFEAGARARVVSLGALDLSVWGAFSVRCDLLRVEIGIKVGCVPRSETRAGT